MSDEDVARIIGKMNTSIEKRDLSSSLSIKDTVRILNGSFMSFTGTVESIDKEKSRVCVAVSILGRVVPVELDFSVDDKNNA